jgi:hypothetical protein
MGWWDWSHHLVYCWYRLHCELARVTDLLYHMEWADVVEERIHHPLGQIWSLVAVNQYWGDPTNYRTVRNRFLIFKDPSCKSYISANLVIWFFQQLHHCLFTMATYP